MKSLFRVNGSFSLFLLLLMILIPLSIGWISSALTLDTIIIFQNLYKPAFAPPGWVFGPVWTILFILMGIASYRIVMLGKQGIKINRAYYLYLIQLLFNFFWSIIFFKLQMRGLAFIELLILLTLIIVTTVLFFNKDKIAGWLMVPYCLWVGFAGILNYSIWQLNK